MNYLEYEVEDLLLDSSFRNYCLGTNAEDSAFWEQWLVLHPDKYELVKEARSLYQLLNGNVDSDHLREAVDQFRDRFEAHEAAGSSVNERRAPVISISLPDTGRRSPRALGKRRSWLAAAAVGLAIVFGAILWERPGSPASSAFHPASTMVSKAGERKSFQLPDGTKVVLNAGSKVEVAGDFNKTTREITLLGEAFFDVAKDAHKVFLIHTATLDIKVLGTTLNVKAYRDDLETATSLLTGSVEVQVKGKSNRVLLKPGEKIVVRNEPVKAGANGAKPESGNEEKILAYHIERMSPDPADSSLAEISWIQHKLVFNDDSFAEMAVALERYYDVTITFEDSEVKAYRFTASFDNKTLEQVLAALAVSRPFEYRQEPGNRIIIKSINMKN